MGSDTLSVVDARRMALAAQGPRGARVTKGDLPAMVRRLGAVQLDTISGQPAGFDQFLAELAGLTAAQLADETLMAALNDKYDIVNLGGVPSHE